MNGNGSFWLHWAGAVPDWFTMTHADDSLSALGSAIYDIRTIPPGRTEKQDAIAAAATMPFEEGCRRERELFVECDLESGLRLRGYVDRLDVAPSGAVRVVDYKTGGAPREAFEARALFQLKFYALVLWRTRGVVPRQLRLMYLSDTDTLSGGTGSIKDFSATGSDDQHTFTRFQSPTRNKRVPRRYIDQSGCCCLMNRNATALELAQ